MSHELPHDTIQRSAYIFDAAAPNRPNFDEYVDNLTSMDRMTPIVAEAVDKARAVRLGHRAVFYIAGPLTGMSEEVKQRYAAVGQLISDKSQPDSRIFGYAPHVHGTDPVKHPDVTPAEVRDVDYLWASVVASGHINFWTPIAHGNAIEAGWAEEHAIPSLHVVERGIATSRLVRGMHNTAGTLTYDNFQTDGLAQLGSFLDHFQNYYQESLE